MTDPNIVTGKISLALAILSEYVRHGIECGSARGLSCDCGLEWHLKVTPWLRNFIPPDVLRTIEYRGEQ